MRQMWEEKVSADLGNGDTVSRHTRDMRPKSNSAEIGTEHEIFGRYNSGQKDLLKESITL